MRDTLHLAHLNRTRPPWRWSLFALDWRFPRGLDWLYDCMDSVWLVRGTTGRAGQGAVLMLLSAQAAVTGDSAAAEQFCADWEREVRAAVPPAQLLTFRASDGWAPLCEFLDTAVPDCPYPRLNNAQQFRLGYTR